MVSLDLIFLMLAVGALAGLVAALGGPRLPVQALVAAGASVAMLALVRPSLIKRLHSGPDLTMGHDRAGRSARASSTARITGDDVGQVRLAGELWSAAPYDETIVIEPGADRRGLRDPRRHGVRPSCSDASRPMTDHDIGRARHS